MKSGKSFGFRPSAELVERMVAAQPPPRHGYEETGAPSLRNAIDDVAERLSGLLATFSRRAAYHRVADVYIGDANGFEETFAKTLAWNLFLPSGVAHDILCALCAELMAWLGETRSSSPEPWSWLSVRDGRLVITRPATAVSFAPKQAHRRAMLIASSYPGDETTPG